MLGESNDMYDEATSIIDDINNIFDKITTTPKGYLDKNNEWVNDSFLKLSINECLIDLLEDIDSLNEKKEQLIISGKTYERELEIKKRNYLNKKASGKINQYVLIPVTVLTEIISTDKLKDEIFHEILDYRLPGDPNFILNDKKPEQSIKINVIKKDI